MIEDVRLELTNWGVGIDMTGPTSPTKMRDNITIRNAYISGASTYAIGLWSPSISTYTMPDNITIENCLLKNFIGTARGIRLNTGNNVIIRRNVIMGAGSYGIYAYAGGTEINDVNIYYNVIYGSGYTDIYCQDGTAYEIYNNTIDGTINSVSSATIRNNFYQSLTSGGTASHNIDIGDITPSNYFTNYLGHNYNLKSTAIGAIDVGYNVSLTPDIVGTTVPQGSATDIGAYEYIP